MPWSVQGAIIYLVCLCVCQCVCNIRRFYSLREYQADLHKLGIYVSGRVSANAWDVFPCIRLELDAVAGLLWISWCVLGRAIFAVLLFIYFFPSNAHGLLQV